MCVLGRERRGEERGIGIVTGCEDAVHECFRNDSLLVHGFSFSFLEKNILCMGDGQHLSLSPLPTALSSHCVLVDYCFFSIMKNKGNNPQTIRKFFRSLDVCLFLGGSPPSSFPCLLAQ